MDTSASGAIVAYLSAAAASLAAVISVVNAVLTARLGRRSQLEAWRRGTLYPGCVTFYAASVEHCDCVEELVSRLSRAEPTSPSLDESYEGVKSAYRHVKVSGTAIVLIISGRVDKAALELAAHHKAMHDLASQLSDGEPWTTEVADRLTRTVKDTSTWRLEFEDAIKDQLRVGRPRGRSWPMGAMQSRRP
jgi:hypothetical protein